MAANYYSLVAGLREFALDSDKKGFDAGAIVEEIRSELTKKDKGYLELFYNFYDIENIINLRNGRLQFSALGNYTREELEQQMKNPEELPRYVARILGAYANPDDGDFDDVDTSRPFEKSIFDAFYEECERSGNRFVKAWYRFDRNLRNVTAALTARRIGVPVADVLVSDGYVVETIAKSSASDFGLKGELSYLDQVMGAMSDEPNLLEKERRIDLIRWNMSDELTPFDYFNMNAILAYLVKINIVHRWVSLDPEVGREMFARLIASMSSEGHIGEAE